MKEIFVWGLKRNGNHALTNYILNHYYNVEDIDRYCRRNDIFINDFGRKTGYHTYPIPEPKEGNVQLISIENPKGKNDLQIDICESNLLLDTKRKITNKKTFIILRDPFNWLSSFYKEYRLKDVENLLDIWKNIAEKYFIKPKDYYFPVLYNKLVTDLSYRKQISNYLAVKHTDRGINKVSSTGSTFDKWDYNGDALNMNVLNRWKFLNKEVEKTLRKRKDIRQISEYLFNLDPYKKFNWYKF